MAEKGNGINIDAVKVAAAAMPDAVYRALGLALKDDGANCFVASCPWHGRDSTPSFKVFKKDGRFHCFGCEADGSVIDFVMKERSEDLPTAIKTCAGHLGVTAAAPPPKKPAPAPEPPVVCEPFADGLQMPPCARGYEGYYYHNAAGHRILFKFRKDANPARYDGMSLQYKGLPKPRPLFNLPGIINAPGADVLVVEGEKAAAAMAAVGILATTWIGGSSAAKLADWQPLAGRRVWLWPDDDQAGANAMATVAQILKGLGALPFILSTARMGDYKDKGADCADIPTDKRKQEFEARRATSIEYTPPPEQKPPPRSGGDGGGKREKQLPIHHRLRDALDEMGEQGKIRTDMATYTVYIQGEEISDGALHKLARLLDHEYEVSVSLNMIKDALGGIAERYPFNSFVEEIEQVEWDGEERLGCLATKYLREVEDPEICNRYLKAWLTAGVARRATHDRAIKFDICVVLRGDEGIGKSSFYDALFGSLIVSHDFAAGRETDTLVIISGSMAVEMPELAGLARADFNYVKGFISRTWDKFRAPYARLPTLRPRRQILCASTNQDSYLNTVTGARRFFDVHVTTDAIDFEGVARDRLQIFAEAYKDWKRWGDTALAIPKAMWAQNRQRNRELIQESPYQVIVDGWIIKEAHTDQDGVRYITGNAVSELMDGDTGTGKGRIQRSSITFSQIRQAFERRGWYKKTVRVGERKENRWLLMFPETPQPVPKSYDGGFN